MTMQVKANSIRHVVEPRDVPPQKAARRLHLNEAEFTGYLDSLYARGFPKPDPTTGFYDLLEIDKWMDKRHEPSFQPANDNIVIATAKRRH